MLYKPLAERIPDTQYRDRLVYILDHGIHVADTPQDEAAITSFGELSPCIYEVENGAPLITERKASFWRQPIGEIIGFINGARTLDELKAFGCHFWGPWATPAKCLRIGVPVGDLGPGSYGAAFHDFPMPDGGAFNQLAHVVEQLRDLRLRKRRTIYVSPWVPFYNGWGGLQKAVVSPCHGWMHWRVLRYQEEERLVLIMWQRSADMPIGVPSNMIQYFALLLMVAQASGLRPWKFIHQFGDAHIYANQVGAVREMLSREPRPFPKLLLNPDKKNIFQFRAEDFSLEEYDPHPPMKIDVAV